MAFAAFIVMMMKVSFEYGFDRCHPEADRIYRVDMVVDGEPSNILPRAFADAVIASSPQIREGTIITPIDEWMGSSYFTTGDDANRKGFREPFETCYPAITQIFGFDFTEGNPDCLNHPENVIIPQSMARRMFAHETAIGQPLRVEDNIFSKNSRSLTVGGVYRDFPDNTQIKNVIYTAIDQSQKNDWMSQNYLLYLLFTDKNEVKAFEDHFNETFDFSPLQRGGKISISLMPLTDIYFSQTGFRAGNINTVRILFAIALLVIAIAAINYMNFSIAMTPMRIRSINTQKILGCSTSTLRIFLTGEAVIMAFASWMLALLLVEGLTTGQFLTFLEADLLLKNHIPLVVATGFAALLTGLLAGLYPAFYATSLQPAFVLNGNFGLSPAGRRLRSALTGFQYIISISLIIAAIFIQKQSRHLRNFDTGFDREHIAIVQLNADIYSKSKDLYADRLKEYAGVEDVAFSKQKLGASDGYTYYTFGYNDRTFGGYTLHVSENFLDVMRIPVIEGRSFMPSDTAGRNLAFILNKPLQASVGVKAGEMIKMTSWGGRACSVVGITDDVKFTSLRQGHDHILFLAGSADPLPVSYIRLKAGANVFDAVDHIRRTLSDIDPVFPFELEFYDDVFNRLYLKELNLNKNISLLSVLAIIISLVGIFGLVLFETQYRRKEIGIRKAFGSTTAEILSLFNRTYLRMLCICFVPAAPIAWYGVNRWMQNFAYKTQMDWWVYLSAFAIVLALTAATVTLQIRRAANSNPVESIKTE